MSADGTDGICAHCGLPVGRRGTCRTLDGESQVFCCYGCSLAYQVGRGDTAESDATWLLIGLGIGVFLAMNIKLFTLLIYVGAFDDADAHLLPLIRVLLWILATPLLLILGLPFARDAWRELGHGRFTVNALMILGVSAAYLYSAIAVLRGGEHVYFDTVALLLVLFTLGRLLEANARARAVRNLAPLLEAERQQATVLNPDGTEQRLRVRDVAPGMRLRVLPGERVPVDGVVVDGHSHLDESIMTGEARPVIKQPDSRVLSGSTNHEGSLIVEATAAGADSHWVRICRTVREALTNRSPTLRLTDRAAAAFVPLVLLLAVCTVIYWMSRGPFEQALFTGLAVLVVACPCALGLAAPLATTLGIGALVQRGALIRGPEVLERLARIRVVAFDKTGTLTAGKFRLMAIETKAGTTDELLRRVAGLEQGSEHPLARGVLHAAAQRRLNPASVTDIRTLPGRGIVGRCDEGVIAAGTAAVLEEPGWEFPRHLRDRIAALEASGQTVIHVGWGRCWRGMLVFGDALLEGAADTVRRLRQQGLHCVLLTGDLPAAAEHVATATGTEAWLARLSPEDKRAQVERLAAERGPVAMVGDGLNDGPVLAAASVGVAVGSATDLARETADVVLPVNGLRLLPRVMDRARRVRSTIFTNLLWAFGYNGIALALAASGYLSPVWAAVIMTGSSLLVIGNSMRLERSGARDETSIAPAAELRGSPAYPLDCSFLSAEPNHGRPFQRPHYRRGHAAARRARAPDPR